VAYRRLLDGTTALIAGRLFVYLDPKEFGVTYQSGLLNKEQDGPLRGSFLLRQQSIFCWIVLFAGMELATKGGEQDED